MVGNRPIRRPGGPRRPCQNGPVLETDAIVLRSIRYGEADSVLTLYTRDRGRVSAIAKGTRKATSKLGGRLQPAVHVHVGLHRGRGEMYTVRQAQVLDAHAGLWMEGHRLRASGSILESAIRVLVEEEPNDGAYNLLCRSLDLLAHAPARTGPPRHDPIVLGVQAKLLVVAGILPQMASCVACGAADPLTAFSPRLGGVLCDGCEGGERYDAEVFQAFVDLIQNPLGAQSLVIGPHAADGVERLVASVFREHLGVRLRSGVGG